jgi:hypothetical protein
MAMSRGLPAAVASGIALWLLGPAAPVALAADHPPRPDAQQQPLKDGCQRSPAPFLAYAAGAPPETPEWAYVYRDNRARQAEGIAHTSDPATGDLPHGHEWYDFNFNLDLDHGYGYLLAGDPVAKNGNFAGNGEDTGRLHLEWESGTLPAYAWPTEGDRVKAWGSWIWDCGHWGQDFEDPDYFIPGTGETPGSTDVRGEQTEFHPMRALVVTRRHQARKQRTHTEADVFISSDGTNARVEEECARQHPAIVPGTYGPDYTACALAGTDRRQPVDDRNYKFFLPAPPRPSDHAHMHYDVVDMVGGRHPSERVRERRDGIEVTIPFKHFGHEDEAVTYGKSFFVSWDEDDHPPTHLRIRLRTLKVFHSLDGPGYDPPSTGTPPGEWGLYLEVNGLWKYLNDWAPGLDHVNDGDSFDLGHSVNVSVPDGVGLRVFTHGRECDLPQIKPCPNIEEGSDDNDSPGDALEEFDSAKDAIGEHTLRPQSGHYELTYTVKQIEVRPGRER